MGWVSGQTAPHPLDPFADGGRQRRVPAEDQPRPRRGRPRGGSSASIVLRPRVDGRVSQPVDDTRRDPLPWTSAGPVGPRTIITLIGARVDQVGEAALNGPPRAKVGTSIIALPTRITSSNRILTRDKTVARRLVLDLQAGIVHTARRRPLGSGATPTQPNGIGRRGRGRGSLSAFTQLALGFQTTCLPRSRGGIPGTSSPHGRRG